MDFALSEEQQAIVRAADQCTVKKHLDHAPAIEVVTVGSAAVSLASAASMPIDLIRPLASCTR